MEPIVHYFVPLLLLLSFTGIPRSYILLFSPLAVLSDLDFLVGHRMLFHNLFFAIALSIFVWAYTAKSRTAFFLTIYYLLSHLLLDLTAPGTALLYPFYSRLIALDLSFTSSPATGAISLDRGAWTNSITEATRDQASPVISAFGMLLTLAVISSLLLGYLFRIRKLRA
ncbi:MAG: metal-dependent hydrolase [archaeon]